MTLYRFEKLLENAEALGIRTMGELQDFYEKNRIGTETADQTLLRVVFAKAVGKWGEIDFDDDVFNFEEV